MNTTTWCWGDVLADPKTKVEKSAFNLGAEHALRGESMASPYTGWLRPFWVAGWRVTRMTVLASACGPVVPTPEQVREALARERSRVHKRAVGPVLQRLGV